MDIYGEFVSLQYTITLCNTLIGQIKNTLFYEFNCKQIRSNKYKNYAKTRYDDAYIYPANSTANVGLLDNKRIYQITKQQRQDCIYIVAVHHVTRATMLGIQRLWRRQLNALFSSVNPNSRKMHPHLPSSTSRIYCSGHLYVTMRTCVLNTYIDLAFTSHRFLLRHASDYLLLPTLQTFYYSLVVNRETISNDKDRKNEKERRNIFFVL